MEFQPHNPEDHTSLLRGTMLWTVACSTLGGVYKAQSTPRLLLDSLTLDGSMAVISYAFMSAVIGYCTKKLLDYFFSKTNKD